MTRPYLELVGVQATNTKRFKLYHIDYIYVRRIDNEYKGYAIMKGYDMTLTMPFHTITTSLMDVYGSVLKNVWRQDDRRNESFYLQFVVAFRPEKVGLTGYWEHWAEW